MDIPKKLLDAIEKAREIAKPISDSQFSTENESKLADAILELAAAMKMFADEAIAAQEE